MQNDELFAVEGTVEDIIFQNELNGYAVCRVSTDDGDTIVIVGTMPYISEGETIRAVGNWVSHASFGRQFKVEYFEKKLPATKSSILKYLSCGTIKGVGPVTAARIVERFGEAAFSVIENSPELLAEIKGISLKKAIEISDSFKSQFGIRNVMIFLQSFGITPAAAVKIYKALGPYAVDMIKSNPYILCDRVSGVGFEKADDIALGLGFEPNSIERICAGLKYALRHNLQNGHTFLPYEKLIYVVCERLGVEKDEADEGLERLISEGSLVSADIGGVRAIYLQRYFRAESYVAMKLTALNTLADKSIDDIDERIDSVQNELGIEFAAMQRKALKQAVSSGVMVLTGGPGTGKTTTLRGILVMLASMRLKIALCAPTGRAAKRMAELTGMEAKTIHRLLEMEFTDEDFPRFGRNEQNPLDAEVVIIDELSMVDILLLEALLRAVRPSTRIIMVGDADQLPSMGAGNVLSDIISSGCVEVVRLTEIFRQARESMIVVNSHLINNGEMIDISRKDGDFFVVQCESMQKICDTVVDLCAYRLPKTYGEQIKDGLQVITPTKKTMAGTQHLNKLLQAVLNPPKPGLKEKQYLDSVFRVGDKVMQIKNNYDIRWTRDGEEGSGVFNGDVGVVEDIDFSLELMTVRFDDRVAEYGFELLEELELAYAITVHKSQGSEFKTVIMPAISGLKLCNRKLLYTAVTRAKEMLIIVGSLGAIKEMIDNDKYTKRYSGLKYALMAANGM